MDGNFSFGDDFEFEDQMDSLNREVGDVLTRLEVLQHAPKRKNAGNQKTGLKVVLKRLDDYSTAEWVKLGVKLPINITKKKKNARSSRLQVTKRHIPLSQLLPYSVDKNTIPSYSQTSIRVREQAETTGQSQALPPPDQKEETRPALATRKQKSCSDGMLRTDTVSKRRTRHQAASSADDCTQGVGADVNSSVNFNDTRLVTEDNRETVRGSTNTQNKSEPAACLPNTDCDNKECQATSQMSHQMSRDRSDTDSTASEKRTVEEEPIVNNLTWADNTSESQKPVKGKQVKRVHFAENTKTSDNKWCDENATANQHRINEVDIGQINTEETKITSQANDQKRSEILITREPLKKMHGNKSEKRAPLPDSFNTGLGKLASELTLVSSPDCRTAKERGLFGNRELSMALGPGNKHDPGNGVGDSDNPGPGSSAVLEPSGGCGAEDECGPDDDHEIDDYTKPHDDHENKRKRKSGRPSSRNDYKSLAEGDSQASLKNASKICENFKHRQSESNRKPSIKVQHSNVSKNTGKNHDKDSKQDTQPGFIQEEYSHSNNNRQERTSEELPISVECDTALKIDISFENVHENDRLKLSSIDAADNTNNIVHKPEIVSSGKSQSDLLILASVCEVTEPAIIAQTLKGTPSCGMDRLTDKSETNLDFKGTPAGGMDRQTDKSETNQDFKGTPAGGMDRLADKSETNQDFKGTPAGEMDSQTDKSETNQDFKGTPAGGMDILADKSETNQDFKGTPAGGMDRLADKSETNQDFKGTPAGGMDRQTDKSETDQDSKGAPAPGGMDGLSDKSKPNPNEFPSPLTLATCEKHDKKTDNDSTPNGKICDVGELATSLDKIDCKTNLSESSEDLDLRLSSDEESMSPVKYTDVRKNSVNVTTKLSIVRNSELIEDKLQATTTQTRTQSGGVAGRPQERDQKNTDEKLRNSQATSNTLESYCFEIMNMPESDGTKEAKGCSQPFEKENETDFVKNTRKPIHIAESSISELNVVGMSDGVAKGQHSPNKLQKGQVTTEKNRGTGSESESDSIIGDETDFEFITKAPKSDPSQSKENTFTENLADEENTDRTTENKTIKCSDKTGRKFGQLAFPPTVPDDALSLPESIEDLSVPSERSKGNSAICSNGDMVMILEQKAVKETKSFVWEASLQFTPTQDMESHSKQVYDTDSMASGAGEIDMGGENSFVESKESPVLTRWSSKPTLIDENAQFGELTDHLVSANKEISRQDTEECGSQKAKGTTDNNNSSCTQGHSRSILAPLAKGSPGVQPRDFELSFIPTLNVTAKEAIQIANSLIRSPATTSNASFSQALAGSMLANVNGQNSESTLEQEAQTTILEQGEIDIASVEGDCFGDDIRSTWNLLEGRTPTQSCKDMHLNPAEIDQWIKELPPTVQESQQDPECQFDIPSSTSADVNVANTETASRSGNSSCPQPSSSRKALFPSLDEMVDDDELTQAMKELDDMKTEEGVSDLANPLSDIQPTPSTIFEQERIEEMKTQLLSLEEEISEKSVDLEQIKTAIEEAEEDLSVYKWKHLEHTSRRMKREIERRKEQFKNIEKKIQRTKTYMESFRKECTTQQITLKNEVQDLERKVEVLKFQQKHVKEKIETDKKKFKEAPLGGQSMPSTVNAENIIDIMDQIYLPRTIAKRANNPTSKEMTRKYDCPFRAERKHETKKVLELVHGGQMGAVYGAADFLLSYGSLEVIKDLALRFKKMRPESSITNTKRTEEPDISDKYIQFTRKRKYKFLCRVQKAVFEKKEELEIPYMPPLARHKLREGHSISVERADEIAEVLPKFLNPVFQIPNTLGVSRTVTCLSLMVADLYLRVPQLYAQLEWFKGEICHFVFQFSDEGGTEDKSMGLSMSIGVLTLWNLGRHSRNPEASYLLHGLTVPERDRIPLMTDIWTQHTDEMQVVEGSIFTIRGKTVTFSFEPSSDMAWQQWAANETNQNTKYPSQYANVSTSNMATVNGSMGFQPFDTWRPISHDERLLNLKKLSEFTRAMGKGLSGAERNIRRREFMFSTGVRQAGPPRIGKYADRLRPEPRQCEVAGWLNMLEVIAKEALQRQNLLELVTVLAAPESTLTACDDLGDEPDPEDPDLDEGEVRSKPGHRRHTTLIMDEASRDPFTPIKPPLASVDNLSKGQTPTKGFYDEDSRDSIASSTAENKEEICITPNNKLTKGRYGMTYGSPKCLPIKAGVAGCGLPKLAKYVYDHFTSVSTTGKVLRLPLTVKETATICRNWHLICEALGRKKFKETHAEKLRRLAIFKIGDSLRQVGPHLYKTSTDEESLDYVRSLLQIYFNLHVLFLGPKSINLTVWTIGNAVLYHMRQLYQCYQAGYGLLMTRPKHLQNRGIRGDIDLIKEIQPRNLGRGKWWQLCRVNYLRTIYVPEHEHIQFTEDETTKYYQSGFRMSRCNDTNGACPMCDHEYMTYIVHSAVSGRVSLNLSDLVEKTAKK